MVRSGRSGICEVFSSEIGGGVRAQVAFETASNANCWRGRSSRERRTRPARGTTQSGRCRGHRAPNQGIEDRIATFETEPRSTADITRLLADRAERYPMIVVERGGEIVARAAAGSYRARPCYDPIAEHSVYVDRDQRRAGVTSGARGAMH